jgi:hypothetical protein
MILFVNGDSHAAAAEAVNPYAFAEDDSTLAYLGRTPHPANLAVSWGRLLSLTLKAGFHCAAESASSNTRILRTTRDWLRQQQGLDDILVIIQWSTWEREEWLYDDIYYQVGASGTDGVPATASERYRNYIIGIDWQQKTQEAHREIWEFHLELEQQNIKHVFFNGNNDFSNIQNQQDWGANYIGPYDPEMTYDAIIRSKGIHTVMPGSWHFGRDGHSAFHRFILDYIIKNKFI